MHDDLIHIRIWRPDHGTHKQSPREDRMMWCITLAAKSCHVKSVSNGNGSYKFEEPLLSIVSNYTPAPPVACFPCKSDIIRAKGRYA